MLLKIIVVLASLWAVFVVVVALRSSDFTVVRSTTIAARPAAVFAEINDFHRWAAWSPWQHLDPAMKTIFSGPPAGVGSVYDWSGNDKAGIGRMTITDSQPDVQIQIRLEFIKPFAATNRSIFTFTPESGQTRVRWEMMGHNNFLFKAASLFMSMDKMIGGDFERGLANLKAVAEKSSSR